MQNDAEAGDVDEDEEIDRIVILRFIVCMLPIPRTDNPTCLE